MSDTKDIGEAIANSLNAAGGFNAPATYKRIVLDDLRNIESRVIIVQPVGFTSTLLTRRKSDRRHSFDILVFDKIGIIDGEDDETQMDSCFATLEDVTTHLESNNQMGVAQLARSVEPAELPEPLAEQIFIDSSLWAAGVNFEYRLEKDI